MKNEELYELLGEIDGQYIADARKPVRRIRWVPIAACLCAVLMLGLVIRYFSGASGLMSGTGILNQAQGERPLLSLWTQWEYRIFLATAELPEDFVTYDMLKPIGQFKGYVNLGEADYSQSYYSFADENGVELALYIKPLEEAEGYDAAENPPDPRDLRTLPEEGIREYYCGALRYRYLEGKLLTIRWVFGDKEFVLYMDGTYSEYPLSGAETFVSRLLNTETAEDALEQLRKEGGFS